MEAGELATECADCACTHTCLFDLGTLHTIKQDRSSYIKPVLKSNRVLFSACVRACLCFQPKRKVDVKLAYTTAARQAPW